VPTFGPHLPYYLPKGYADLYDPARIELPESVKEMFEGKPQVQKNYADYWAFECFTEDQWRRMIAMYWGGITLIDEQVGRRRSSLSFTAIISPILSG